MVLRVVPAVKSSKYEALKSVLLEAFDLTKSQRAAKLLHLQGLGDRLPSVLTSEIVALVPEGISPDYLERQIFLEQLPADVQQNMAAHESKKDFMKLAKIADGYVIVARERGSGMSCAVTVPQSSSDTQPQIQQQPGFQMTCDSSPCCAVGGQGQSSTTRKLCFFHQCFGGATRKCGSDGCTWRMRQHQPPLSASVATRSTKHKVLSSIFRIYDFASGMNFFG